MVLMNNKIKKISIIAMFSAIGGILMFLDFQLPIFLSFMKMDLSDLPVIIGGFIFGPLDSIIIAVLKILIKLLLKPTSTVYVGEIANLIGSILYSLPASLIYIKFKNKKRAIIGLIIGVIVASVGITICNMIFIFPFYMQLFNITDVIIIGMCNKIFPYIDSMLKVYLLSVLPFNLVKYGLSSIITFLFYKRISKTIKYIL